MVIIKVYMGNDARRITVDDHISFADLRALLLNLFSVSGSGEPTSLKPTQLWIRYVDDEDDLVSIATDADLHEAIAYSLGRADILRLRLYIEPAAEGADDTNSNTKKPSLTAAGVNAIPHHTLQHRNNLVLQSLGQPEFAVQVSKMVRQVVSTQNTALTDLVQQMVLALAPQMETLLAPAVATVLQQHQAALVQQQQQQQLMQLQQQQQQQQQQQYPPAYFYAAQQQSPLQAPNTYPAWPMQTPPPPAPGSMPSSMTIPPHASPSSTGPGVPAGLPEPLTPLPAAASTPPAAEKKKESTTPSGISAVRNILPSIFKVGIPTAAPGAADKTPPQPQPQSQPPDGPTRTMSSSSSSPPRSNDRRKRSTSSIHESDFSWVEPSEGGAPPGSGGGGGGGSGSGKWELPTARSRSSSNPVPIVPSRTSSTSDLSFMSPSTPSPLAAAAASSTSLSSSSPFPSFSPSTPPSMAPSFPSSSSSPSLSSSTIASSSSSTSSPRLMASSSPPTRPRGPPALPPMSVNLNEEQYQQLYRDWAPVLKELAQMGFEDPRRNIDLLRTHKGSMVDVVEQLLSVPKT